MRYLLIFFFIPFLFGFTLTPMSHSIKLDEKEKQAQFFVENPSDEPMAVQITLTKRIQKEDGSEETPKTDELTAFPPQLIVPPKEKRSIRVTYKGEKPEYEKSFRLIAEQLPVDVKKEKKKGSGIKMLLKYVAALYVNPGKTKHDVHVTAIKRSGKSLKLTLENRGTTHAPMLSPELVLEKGDTKIVLKDQALKGLVGENILAKTKRTFILPDHAEVNESFRGKLIIE